MKKYFPLKLPIILFIFLVSYGNVTAVSQPALPDDAPATLTSIRIDENGITIKSNRSFTYALDKGDDPYRATIEIPEMNPGIYTGRIHSDIGVVSEVIPRQVSLPKPAVKIDLVLQQPSLVTPEYKNNTLVLTIKKDSRQSYPEAKVFDENARPVVRLVAEERPAEHLSSAASSSSRATEISNIEIKRLADTVKVFITGNGAMIPNVFPINERIVVDIPDIVLRAAIPVNTIAPLKSIRAGKHKDKLRIVMDLREKTNFDVTAIGNTIEISLFAKEAAVGKTESSSIAAPEQTAVVAGPAQSAVKEPAAPAPLTEGVFTGKKISLDFQDADIVPIFRLLGDISGYNVVVSPEVKGKITLKLINVPWDQALDVILRTFTLAKIVDGNILRIVPAASVAKELDESTKAKKAASEAGDLVTRLFPVNYANVEKIREALEKAKVLSSRGSISLDKDSSNIIVNDLEANLQKVETLLKEIDTEAVQARQVMIEAKIVEVNTDYLNDLGVQWGAFFARASEKGAYAIGPAGLASMSKPGNWLVNVPAASSVGNLGFGFINRAGTFALDLRLSAMEETKKGKILSNPRIMTMNNIEASIKQGRELQLPSTDKDGQPKLQSVPVDLTLKVTPKITPAGSILLDVNIIKKELLQLINAGGNVGADTTNTDIKTKVLINSGETLVVGGVYKYSEAQNEQGIPGLSKVPVLGMLFKNDNRTNNQFEIMVFITPRVIESEGPK